MRKILFIVFICIIGISKHAECQKAKKFTRAVAAIGLQGSLKEVSNSVNKEDLIRSYYKQALDYKDGTNGTKIDYRKAFEYFSKAAALGDEQSIYAVSYLYYKGLGVVQNYNTAAKLFGEGAYKGRGNSCYFYGLCFRNGYGKVQNEDSARYWLEKSAAQGYRQAKLELQMKAPENSNDSARKLIHSLHNAALPKNVVLNQFVKLIPQLPDTSIIRGVYNGFIIQFDWSGQNPIYSSKLKLVIDRSDKIASQYVGSWNEEGIEPVKIRAILAKDSLRFLNSSYRRKDHYSPDDAITYEFKNAALNFIKKNDTVFLAGNINMFSPQREEPSKPIFIVLTKTAATNEATDQGVGVDSMSIAKNKIKSAIADSVENNINRARLVSVYPNPFGSYLYVEFEITAEGHFGVELYDMGGKLVYQKKPQFLSKGKYQIKIDPSSSLPTQTYTLRLFYENGQADTKVIKR